MNLAPASFQTNKSQITISYKLKGDSKVIHYNNELLEPGKPLLLQENVRITTKTVPHSDGKGGYLLSISVQSGKAIELLGFEASYFAELRDLRMMANGFQSWSQAREFTKNDKIPGIRSGIAWYTQYNLQG